jgi:hypothetical protein
MKSLILLFTFFLKFYCILLRESLINQNYAKKSNVAAQYLPMYRWG